MSLAQIQPEWDCREIDSVVIVEDETPEIKAHGGDKHLYDLEAGINQNCFISSIEIRDIDDNDGEWAGCYVSFDTDTKKWTLTAYTDGNEDQDAKCRAICFSWEYQ